MGTADKEEALNICCHLRGAGCRTLQTTRSPPMLVSLLLLACTTDIGIVTKECTTVFYPDSDGDGYGDESNAAELCETEGYVSTGGDCDDGDASVSPEGAEVCDGEDNDCDGLTDDEDDSLDQSTQGTWYVDADADGYGDEAQALAACELPEGYAVTDGDCDDVDAALNPEGLEVCDDQDNDCDGLTDDEDDSLDLDTAGVWYDDLDGDGYGDADAATVSCAQPEDTVTADGDCDDVAWAINPSAAEVCDDLDNDCDGLADDADEGLDTSTATSWYADLDGDGFGDDADSTLACDAPAYHAEEGGDCDDGDADSNPDATEVCDGADNDCDGETDDEDASLDESTASTWYLDGDEDGYGGDSLSWVSCASPSSRFVDNVTDCDDGDAEVHPDATETCDDVDQDCDGVVDDDPEDVSTWYADGDADGYGDPRSSTDACDQPSGYVENDDDCDDDTDAKSPGADEICDDLDNDCDGSTDESSAVDATTWYADDDSDGYGDADRTRVACDQPSGYTDDDTDCDDKRRAVNPSETELCDDLDNDCDGSTDEADALDADTWFRDGDEDGYGDADDTTTACSLPDGYVSNDDDCDDDEDDASPARSEVCDDIDNDCDSVVDESTAEDVSTWYIDRDRDGYGDADLYTVACDQPSGYVDDDDDCDDLEDEANPAETEVCDDIDNDCDGTVDEGDATDALTWYEDADEDGYGEESSTTSACTQPSGFVADATDCDDSNSYTWPDAPERCDAEDNDCDGDVDESFYADDFSEDVDESLISINGDGYVESSEGVLVLTLPSKDQETTANLIKTAYTNQLYVGFDFEIGGGHGTSGADGVNFFIADADTAYTEVSTESGGSGLGITGNTGWGFAVDTYGNSGYGSSGDVLKVWDLEDGTWYNYGSLSQMQSSGTHSFELVMSDGAYGAYIDGSAVASGTLDGWTDTLYRLGVSAATGSSYNYHKIDNLVIGCSAD